VRRRRRSRSTRSRRKPSLRSSRRRYSFNLNPLPLTPSILLTLLQHSGVNAQAEQEATREVEAKLQEIKRVGEEKTPKVVEELVNAVIDIQPKPHRNAAKVA